MSTADTAETWPTDPMRALGAALTAYTYRGGDAAAHALRIVYAAGGYRPAGTLRAWMTAHDGQRVDTLQVRLDGTRNAWMPLGRTVDASRAGSVQLDGSRRDYAGMRVLETSHDGIVVTDGHAVIAYAVSPEGGTL